MLLVSSIGRLLRVRSFARSNARRSNQGRRHARSHTRRPCAAGRWLAWRIHLGRARSAARGALAADRRHFRHVGRRDECRRAGRRLRKRRGRRSEGRPRDLLAPRLGSGALQPVSARTARCDARPMDAELVAHVRGHGSHVSPRVALSDESGGEKSATRDSSRSGRFQAAGEIADQALHHRNQCADRPRSRVQERCHYARGSACVGMSAHHVSGYRDRQRALLGRRLFRQSHDYALGQGVQIAGHHSRYNQPGRAQGTAAIGSSRFSTG